jgi:Mrp family chromosome partitioning ATPase
MRHWLTYFRSAPDVDIVLFDMPPILSVADGVALAATGEVPVVVVIQTGRTRRRAVLRAKEQLDVLGVKVAGVVLNGVRRQDREYT